MMSKLYDKLCNECKENVAHPYGYTQFKLCDNCNKLASKDILKDFGDFVGENTEVVKVPDSSPTLQDIVDQLKRLEKRIDAFEKKVSRRESYLRGGF